jgi:hypothetical protein
LPRKFGVWPAVCFLLLVMVVGLSTKQESPSWDSGDHIYAGYMEPTSQTEWRPIVEKKLEQAGAKGPA